ncbi:MAG: ABC transporter permease [Hyphomicrobiaceae bacterium]|nr:ABC transporter permease [Hyphomicrobiaceae bacterium]
MARTGRQSLGHSLGEIWPLFPGLFLLLVVFALPLAGMLPESFVDADGVGAHRYREIVSDSYYLTVLARSFWLSLVATLICLVLGYPVAYTLVRLTPEGWKRVVYMIVIAPLFTSAVIRAMAWLVILGRQGIVNDALLSIGLIDVPIRLLYTNTAVIIGLVYIMIPFMVLTIAAVLENVNSTLEEAARDLGAAPLVAFWKVTFPLTLPGVFAGSFLVFALCLSSYVTPALLGGGRNKVVAMLIFEQFMRNFNWPLGAALSCVLLFITLLIIWGYNRALARNVVGGRTGREAML